MVEPHCWKGPLIGFVILWRGLAGAQRPATAALALSQESGTCMHDVSIENQGLRPQSRDCSGVNLGFEGMQESIRIFSWMQLACSLQASAPFMHSEQPQCCCP